MDNFHDKFTAEVPFDAVSKQVNETVTRYHDGKDKYLEDGYEDCETVREINERFYEKLKEVVASDDPTEEDKLTKLGRFYISPTNDYFEIACEAFSEKPRINSLESDGLPDELGGEIPYLQKICDSILTKCEVELKYHAKNMASLNLNTKGDESKPLEKVNVSDTKEYVKAILDKALEQGNKTVETCIDDFSKFMADATNAFNRLNNEYISRQERRYSTMNYITDTLMKAVKAGSNTVSKDFSTDSTYEKETISTIKKANEEIKKYIASIKSNSMPVDFCLFAEQPYEFDISSFAVKRYDTGIQPSHCLRYEDYLAYAASNKGKFPISPTASELITTLKGTNEWGSSGLSLAKTYGSINVTSTKNAYIGDIVGELTVEDYVRIIEKYNEAIGFFIPKGKSSTKSLINSTIKTINATIFTIHELRNTINKVSSTFIHPSAVKFAKLMFSIITYVIIDTTSLVRTMALIAFYDYGTKLYIHSTVQAMVEFINKAISYYYGESK